METTNRINETTVTWLKYEGEFNFNSPKISHIELIHEKNIDLSDYKKIYHNVGKKYGWVSRLTIQDNELLKIIKSNGVEIFFLKKYNKNIGFLELDYRDNSELRIVHLGLIEKYIGQGLGKFLLHAALRFAKIIEIKPIVLQTNTLDHPRALTFYQHNGFVPYSRRNAKIIKAI
ncbi:MAG: hypothetical protein CML87_01400 [Rhodobiaceae bacterium]|jgi:GNAT superfamily N-acetyltransferase|nr:hypothetical protein [Rhodobiaceae bacterium]|tara:strand:- start:2872 stop:3393 length:522 start_codon:yes stop_codon:yes gene_type:complete